jgi:hypothetical protein
VSEWVPNSRSEENNLLAGFLDLFWWGEVVWGPVVLVHAPVSLFSSVCLFLQMTHQITTQQVQQQPDVGIRNLN